MGLPAALVLLVMSYLFKHGLPPALLPRPTTAMTRKKITGDELSARAKENGYQGGAHRDNDSLRDQNKYVDKVKMDQNAALDRNVLTVARAADRCT